MIHNPVRSVACWTSAGATLTALGIILLSVSTWAPVILSAGLVCLLLALSINTETRRFDKEFKEGGVDAHTKD